MEPKSCKVLFKITDECVDHLLDMEIEQRFDKFTDLKFIDVIAYKIDRGSKSETIYFQRLVNSILSSIGSISPLLSGKILYNYIFHIYHIHKRLKHEILNLWIDRLFENYIETNKIKFDGNYMLLKKINLDGEFDIVPVEIKDGQLCI